MFFQWISCLVIGGVFAASELFAAPLSVSVHAESAILINADTGAILFEKNPHDLHFPASITKIATAIYALKMKGDHLDDVIAAEQESIGSVSPEVKRRSNYTLPSHWIEQDGSHIGIKKGEELSFRDLLYGMMVASGDDAANVIAQYVGGTIPNFMTQLNAYLKEIGCQKTVLHNPHGLHHPLQQTTAFEMAQLTREAMKNPLFRQIVSTVRYTRPKTNKQQPTTLVQTNLLLRNGRYHYPKAIGVKTGYMSHAQHTFVGAAKNGDRTLIVVFLKVKDRGNMFLDSAILFEAAFNQQKVERILLKAGAQKFAFEQSGLQQPVKSYLKDDFTISYYPAEEPKVKCLLFWIH